MMHGAELKIETKKTPRERRREKERERESLWPVLVLLVLEWF